MAMTMNTVTFPTQVIMTAEEALWYEFDKPSASDLARYAMIAQQLEARKAAGVINGRDWTGVLVGAHDKTCICNGCVSNEIWASCAIECGLPSVNGRKLAYNTALPHQSANCPGNCKTHPLLDAAALEFREQEDCGNLWGDIAERDYIAARAAETPEQKRLREVEEAKEAAASDAAIVRYSVNKKADKWCARGSMKFRVPRPCKYESLFRARICASCESHVPEGQTHCTSRKGHQVCGEQLAGCWSHSKGQCIYVHPNEPQWADALSGVLCYDRERQIFHLRGDEPAPVVRDFRGLAAPQERPRPRSRW